jgi:hypothetical protein
MPRRANDAPQPTRNPVTTPAAPPEPEPQQPKMKVGRRPRAEE